MGLSKDNRFCYSLNAYTRHVITVVVVRTETRTGIRYEGTHTERCLWCGKVTETRGETFRPYDHLTRPSEATMARWNEAYREYALELFGTDDRRELTDYEDAKLVEFADSVAFAA
jgi:hypothetical protein